MTHTLDEQRIQLENNGALLTLKDLKSHPESIIDESLMEDILFTFRKDKDRSKRHLFYNFDFGLKHKDHILSLRCYQEVDIIKYTTTLSECPTHTRIVIEKHPDKSYIGCDFPIDQLPFDAELLKLDGDVTIR